MVAILVGFVVRVHMLEPRLAGVENPEQALALIVGRTMDGQVALRRAPVWEQKLYALTLTDASSEIGQAIAWYEELADESLVPDVDLRLAILLGEAGRRERLAHVLAPWPSRGEPLSTYAGVLTGAYLGTEEIETGDVGDTVEALGPGWFADALSLRVATRLGEPALAEAARRDQDSRARVLLTRIRVLAALDVVLVALGLLAARALWRRRPWRSAVADAPVPPPWEMSVGLATLVRGAALAGIVMALLLVTNHGLVDHPILSEAIDQPLMYIPLLLLVWRSLLAPAGLGFVRAFGLRPRPDGWRPWVLAAALLVGVGIVIDIVLGLLGDRLGLAAHWSEWFDAGLAWGSPAVVAVTFLGSVVFAPIFEELIFRGLLYGTLRTRLAWPLAASASALVFALAHGYGVAGFLSVFLSGFLWSWVYERTGSLLPSMAAHMVNNLTVALTLTAMLR
ncbi:MAG TPA: CPBP family intramembrane glutamic endopeptidase [Methylomirabilota bacterium]|nr:CPBP family intramembrane glutamic endopeptidase [Methylomirabilota bacterium]